MKKHIFNHLIFALLAASMLMLGGCGNNFLRDEIYELHQEIDSLKFQIAEINTNISAMQTIVEAIQDKDYVTSVEPVEKDGKTVGYTISFTKSKPITIYHGAKGEDGLSGQDGIDGTDGVDGKDGHSPVVGVRKDTDGVYYWTLDGEWLLNAEKEKIQADGHTPELKIEEGNWFLSYDKGQTWKDLGPAKGDSMFDDVIVSDSEVRFKLSNGETLVLPRFGIGLELGLASDEAGIFPGETISIDYRILNPSEGVQLSVLSDGKYQVSFDKKDLASGVIHVTCPETYVPGYITVIVNDGRGYSLLRVVNFYENRVHIEKDEVYHIAAEGGKLDIAYSANLNCQARIISDSPWLELLPETKAEMKDHMIHLSASANNTFNQRIAEVGIYVEDKPDKPFKVLDIIQESSYFQIESSRYAVPHQGKKMFIEVKSTMGLKVEPSVSWIRNVRIEELSKNNYRLVFDIPVNDSGKNRKTDLVLLSSEGVSMRSVEIVQLSDEDENPDIMIMRIQVGGQNSELDLPFNGYVDCLVDWGDGQVGFYNRVPISHNYSNLEPKIVKVKVMGRVPIMDSSIKDMTSKESIVELVQWGKLGLQSLEYAFFGQKILEKVSSRGAENLGEIKSLKKTFSGCLKLESVPADLFKYMPEVSTVSDLFSGCSALTSIPEDLFANCPEITQMNDIFANCSSLDAIPANLFRSQKKVTNMSWMFMNCKSLKSIPARLLDQCRQLTAIDHAFSGCTSLQSLPRGLFDYCEKLENLSSIFFGCSALERVPTDLFDNNLHLTDLSNAFSGCEKLSGESPYSIVRGNKVHLYEREKFKDEFTAPEKFGLCFLECRKLQDYDAIPDSWKKDDK